MKGLVHRILRRWAIGLTMLLVCFLWAKTYASTSKVQTYVSRDGSINLALDQSSSFLFAQQMEDTIKVEKVDSIILKDPKRAIFYAFIPGILVHGSGHFYAGKTKTGFLLLGAEVTGTCLVFLSALAGLGEAEGGESYIDPELWGFGGLVLFVGSWVYDVVKSPMVVKKQNEELLQRKHSELEFQITDECLKLVVRWKF